MKILNRNECMENFQLFLKFIEEYPLPTQGIIVYEAKYNEDILFFNKSNFNIIVVGQTGYSRGRLQPVITKILSEEIPTVLYGAYFSDREIMRWANLYYNEKYACFQKDRHGDPRHTTQQFDKYCNKYKMARELMR